MPYDKKKIVSDNQLKFYKELKKATDEEQLIIMTKVCIKEMANITDELDYLFWLDKISEEYIDFIICSQNLNIIMAIDLSNNNNKSYKSMKNNDFKNEFFKTIRIPLIKIKPKRNYKSEEIRKMLFDEPKYPNITYNY